MKTEQKKDLDYYLYSILLEEKTEAIERFITRSYSFEETRLNENSFQEELKALGAWYLENFPDMMDLTKLRAGGTVFYAIIQFKKDLEKLVSALGKSLSDFSSEESIWKDIAIWLDAQFSQISYILIPYFKWTHLPERTPVDMRSIPPVGRYIGQLKRYHAIQEKAERQQNKEISARLHPVRAEEKSQEERSFKRDRKRSFSDDRQKGKKIREEDLSEATKDVERAIEKLTKNTELQDVLLKPQNSFIRHSQHKMVLERGFNSDSCGEGAKRRVRIFR